MVGLLLPRWESPLPLRSVLCEIYHPTYRGRTHPGTLQGTARSHRSLGADRSEVGVAHGPQSWRHSICRRQYVKLQVSKLTFQRTFSTLAQHMSTTLPRNLDDTYFDFGSLRPSRKVGGRGLSSTVRRRSEVAFRSTAKQRLAHWTQSKSDNMHYRLYMLPAARIVAMATPPSAY